MTEQPFHLLNWVEEHIRPENLIHMPQNTDFMKGLTEEFVSELKCFRAVIFKDLLLSKKQAIYGVVQLVEISNMIHGYTIRYQKMHGMTSFTPKFRSFYIYILSIIEKVLEEVKRISQGVHEEVPITSYSLPEIKMKLKRQYLEFSRHIDLTTVDFELRELLKRGIRQMIFKRGIKRSNVFYCESLMKIVVTKAEIDTDSLLFLLIRNGFNLPEFYLYYVTNFKRSIENLSGLHDQLELLLAEKDKLNSIPINKNKKMLRRIVHIREQLYGYIHEKEKNTAQMLNLRRQILQDDQLLKSTKRIRINLPVSQLALFIRIQLEKGLLVKENISELFNFYAEHFYTPKTLFISGESLRKKSTEVEFSTAQKLKSQLISMLNWLNENYNLSNFK